MEALMEYGIWCLALSLFLAGIAFASDNTGLQVYVYGTKGSDCNTPDRLPAGAELLFDAGEVADVIWDEQTLVMNKDATGRLVANIPDMEKEVEDFAPRGKYPDAEGKSFAIVIDGAVVQAGRVAGMDMLQKPPDCPLLYPAFPMIRDGKLALAFGKPASDAELGEDFFTVLIEEGPAACFKPVLEPVVQDYFRQAGSK
jgi:hypothetical protein